MEEAGLLEIIGRLKLSTVETEIVVFAEAEGSEIKAVDTYRSNST
jgi:hypothetical protein